MIYISNIYLNMMVFRSYVLNHQRVTHACCSFNSPTSGSQADGDFFGHPNATGSS